MTTPINIGDRIAHHDDCLAGVVIGFCEIEFISYTDDDDRVYVPGITYTTDCGWTRRIPLEAAVKV
jgi:hypothetical protein